LQRHVAPRERLMMKPDYLQADDSYTPEKNLQ
jgi:hypothetical protein